MPGAPTQMTAREESSDMLPFDFTADEYSDGGGEGEAGGCGGGERVSSSSSISGPKDTSSLSSSTPSHGANTSAPPTSTTTTAFSMVSSAAAVGAFMKLVRDAQPISGLSPVPLKDGMDQLSTIRSRLQAVGVGASAAAEARSP